MSKKLAAQLTKAFKAPTARRPDLHRKARERAKALAKQHNIEIEPIEGGFNVWPPKGFSGIDLYQGDHFALDWDHVLTRVQSYVTPE